MTEEKPKCLCERPLDAGQMFMDGWRYCAYCGRKLFKEIVE